MSLAHTAELLGGRLRGEDVVFHGVSIDSRTLREGELFVALTGRRHDGHAFLDAAANDGAAGALVRKSDASLPCVEVPDTLAAMGELARRWRAERHVEVIGVTGSNGKTTVKEMIASVLARRGPTLATSGNYNNEIGVPLTLFRLAPSNRYAVIEMGANHPGEIAHLAGLAGPGVGVVTNAAPAHLEGFGSVEGVARAKGELFSALPPDGIAVINMDDAYAALWLQLAGSRRVVGFGLETRADVGAEDLREGAFTLRVQKRKRPVRLALPGRHNVQNALAAAACAHGLGVDVADIAAGLAGVQPMAGRAQWKDTPAGARIMDDSYNANPASLRVALDILAERPGERWLVLGDMGELGEQSARIHADAGADAAAAGVARLYTLGALAARAAENFSGEARSFDDVQALVAELKQELHEDVVCLVKGSRAMGMERVVDALMAGSGES